MSDLKTMQIQLVPGLKTSLPSSAASCRLSLVKPLRGEQQAAFRQTAY
jgi:hypothetical protein